jgi:hypothetical protein
MMRMGCTEARHLEGKTALNYHTLNHLNMLQKWEKRQSLMD